MAGSEAKPALGEPMLPPAQGAMQGPSAAQAIAALPAASAPPPGPPIAAQAAPGLPYAAPHTQAQGQPLPPAQHQMFCGVLPMGDEPRRHTCQYCQQLGQTEVKHEISCGTHIAAGVLCCFVCWPCAWCPYVCESCQGALHYCPHCHKQVGEKVFITK